MAVIWQWFLKALKHNNPSQHLILEMKGCKDAKFIGLLACPMAVCFEESGITWRFEQEKLLMMSLHNLRWAFHTARCCFAFAGGSQVYNMLTTSSFTKLRRILWANMGNNLKICHKKTKKTQKSQKLHPLFSLTSSYLTPLQAKKPKTVANRGRRSSVARKVRRQSTDLDEISDLTPSPVDALANDWGQRGATFGYPIVLCWSQWKDKKKSREVFKICSSLSWNLRAIEPAFLFWHLSAEFPFWLQLSTHLNCMAGCRQKSSTNRTTPCFW